MSTTLVLQVVVGLAALWLLFGKSVSGLASRLLARGAAQETPPQADDTVALLSALIAIRRKVSSDQQATNAIDTVITPAIVRAEDAKR